MSAFRRGMLLAGAFGAVAATLATSPAWAGGRGLARRVPLLAPEAPPSFGAHRDVSPLIAKFNAARARQNDALSLSLFAEPKLDVPAFAATAPGDGPDEPKGPAAAGTGFAAAPASAPSASPDPQNAPPVTEPPAAPPLTPMQIALEAATERLVAAADQPNPLGAGDWRAARAAIAFFYAARDYRPVWVGGDGLTQAGRAVLAQLERASDDGLSLGGLPPARNRPRPRPRRARRSRDRDRLGRRDLCGASDRIARPARAGFAAHFCKPQPRRSGRSPRRTAAASDPTRRLADFNPPQKGYRDLKEEWMRLLAPAPGASEPDANLRAGPPPAKAGRPAKRPAGGRIRTASADPALAFGALARERAAILATWRCGAGSRATWASGGSRSTSRTSRSRSWRATPPSTRRASSSASPKRRPRSFPM